MVGVVGLFGAELKAIGTALSGDFDILGLTIKIGEFYVYKLICQLQYSLKYQFKLTIKPHNITSNSISQKMFGNSLQNKNPRNTNFPQQQIPHGTGYNTQRYQRYPPLPQQNKRGKNITSGQFSNLKKAMQQPKPSSQLIIRQCDPTQLNHYKKPQSGIRAIDDNIYQQPYPQTQYPPTYPTSTSNKKQRITSRKTFDLPYTPSSKQPLEELHYINSDNMGQKSQRYSASSQFDTEKVTQIQSDLQKLKQVVYQMYNEHSIEIKKVKTTVNKFQVDCMGEIQSIAAQFSAELNKQKEQLVTVNKKTIDNQRELRYQKDSFNAFVKDNEEKLQSIVMDMNGNKKSLRANNDEFGVDLKTSSHCISGGVGTSMSINFQNDNNINMKLYNEMSAQLQVLKAQLQIYKEKIQLLQKDTKILQLQKKTSKQQPRDSQKDKIDLSQVQKLIIEKFSQQRKRNQFSQKLQQLDLKTKDLYKVYQDMDSNIKGMNAQFTRVINGTVIKKQKMLQTKMTSAQQKINDLIERLSPSSLQQKITNICNIQFMKLLQKKSSSPKIIKIRPSTKQQSQKLASLKNSNQTYMIDEQGHLLDSQGHYIVEAQDDEGIEKKRKVKVDKNLMYLLQAQGICVKTIG